MSKALPMSGQFWKRKAVSSIIQTLETLSIVIPAH
jgi:hypothetical protein